MNNHLCLVFVVVVVDDPVKGLHITKCRFSTKCRICNTKGQCQMSSMARGVTWADMFMERNLLMFTISNS